MLRKSLVFILLLVLFSCFHGPKVGEVDDIGDIKQGEVLVFGRTKIIRRYSKGPDKPAPWQYYMWTKLYLLEEETSKTVHCSLNTDGSFYWHLPPGKYVISHWSNSQWGPKTGRIWAEFKVEDNKQAIYIGTLRLTQKGGWSYFWTAVENDYDEAVQALRIELPEFKGETSKNLMRLEESK